MSRGYGEIERLILERVATHDGLTPAPVMALGIARIKGVPYTPHLRASVRRAASRLHEAGEISAWEIECPTRLILPDKYTAWRMTTCYGPPGFSPSDQDWAQAQDDMRKLVVAQVMDGIEELMGRNQPGA